MQKSLSAVSLVALGLLGSAGAHATDITFNELAVGTTLSNQYAALGVTFAPNAFSGVSPSGEGWATNTDMTIVSSSGADVGDLGAPALVSGNLLRSYGGWLSESGDPSFAAIFSAPIASFSATFAGVLQPANVRIYAYNGASFLGSAVSGAVGQYTLSFSATSITRVVVAPGSINDWVGVDNIQFFAAVVPEPQTYVLMAFGVTLLGALLRHKRRA